MLTEDRTATVVKTFGCKAGPDGAVATATPPEALEKLAETAILAMENVVIRDGSSD